jgi:serine/threonine protein kinase
MSDDLKPRLANFGSCKILGDAASGDDPIQQEPSPAYSSPEVNLIEGENSDSNELPAPQVSTETPADTKETDVWAFGLVGAEVRVPSCLTGARKALISTRP